MFHFIFLISIFFYLNAFLHSCLILIATLIFLALAFDPLGSSSSEAAAAAQGLPYNLEGSETEQLFQGARQAATRVWATRVRLLCCCVASEDAAGAFDHVAGVMRDFFMVSRTIKKNPNKTFSLAVFCNLNHGIHFADYNIVQLVHKNETMQASVI